VDDLALDGNGTDRQEVKFGPTRLLPSRSVENARKEVSRLPRWAMRENDSNDSLVPIDKRDKGGVCGDYDDRTCSDVGGGGGDDTGPLTLFANSRLPFPENSPLRSLSSKHATPPLTTGRYQDSSRSEVCKGRGRITGGRGDWEQPGKTKQGGLVDLPVTFHCRVKSSGYGKPDVQHNRWKQTRHPGGPQRSKSAPRSTKTSDRTTVASRIRMYPKDCGPLNKHQPYNDYPPKVSNIPLVPHMNIKFTEDGSLLGVVSGGNTVGTLKTPISRYKGEGLNYLGHDAQVTDMGFAHKESMLITSSVDGTARIWKMGKVDSSAVEISHKLCNPKVGEASGGGGIKRGGSTHKSSTQTSRNKPFGTSVTGASFFYMDQFALLVIV
jgi:hypothetical protein